MRKLALAMVASSFLFSGSALGQAVTDVGEVFVDGDGNLSIGVDGFGGRTVDASSDGPYTSATLGVNAGSSGELTLDNQANFSTSGELTVGSQGDGFVEVLGGSQLLSGSARLRAPNSSLSSVVVSGTGSTWVNNGLLDLAAEFATVRVSDGAVLSTHGISSVPASSAGEHQIVVEGPGSMIQNSETTSLRILDLPGPALTIRNGGSLLDVGAEIVGVESLPSGVVVRDPGTVWTSGDIGITSARLLVENGAMINAHSLVIQEFHAPSIASVDGPGTTVDLSGSLSVFSSFAPSTLSIGGGAHVRSAGAEIRSTGGLTIGGSTWENDGNIDITLASSSGRFLVGGQVYNRNADYLGCFGCTGAIVTGADSLWHNSEDVSLNGLTAIRNGGTLFVGGRLDVLDGGTRENGRLSLEDGVVQASVLVVDAGTLAGQGEIESQVTNSGTVDPGDSETQMPGTLAIDGTYSQDATGSLEILLTGSDVHLFDKVTVTGAVELAGELAVSVGDGFATELGDTFVILEYDSRTGEFDQITGAQLAEGLSLRPVYGAQTMYLETVPEPSTALMVGCGLVALSARRRLLA